MTKSRHGNILLLDGTHNGGFAFRSEACRGNWKIDAPNWHEDFQVCLFFVLHAAIQSMM